MPIFSWSHLPDELIRECVLPYSYSPQPPELCADIRSFHNTYTNMCEIYDLAYPVDDESKEWLSNDIVRYLNGDVGTMYGYEDFYVDIYRRIYMNQQKHADNIVKCIKKMEDAYPIDIKIHIALLTPNERLHLEDFLMGVTLMGH